VNPDSLRPDYVPRGEEERIRAEALLVRESGQSRALLVYGPGGVGKTSLVRSLALAQGDVPGFAWLDPVDVDDPEYWLLATLEHSVASQLDPEGRYFGPYLRYLSQLPGYIGAGTGREMVVSHLGRIKRVFVDCYTRYIAGSETTVVMTFDTVEAMRGIYLLYTLTQWMKSLPGTLFILSGRPMVAPGDRADPIRDELDDTHANMPVSELTLGPFSHDVALRYLSQSEVSDALSTSEMDNLVMLTQGHPLWLAFAVSHIRQWGLPLEATSDPDDIRRRMPYGAELGRDGQRLQEEFKRRLVAPYREVDFWHEAIKRLAVVRQPMSKQIWQRLMSDLPLPPEATTPGDAWRMLRMTPWVRTRAQGRYVTLHDAVAEELAQRVVSLHDSDQSWRKGLWKRAAAIYRELAAGPVARLSADQARVDDQFRALANDARESTGDYPLSNRGAAALRRPEARPDAGHEQLIEEVVHLDERGREIDQLRVNAFHYQLLSDFAVGTRQFVELFTEAKQDYDVFLQDRLALEMQRFLPGTEYPFPLEDVVASVLKEFATWLVGPGRECYLETGMLVGGYLIDNEHPKTAIALLNRLPADVADRVQQTNLEVLKANAYLRIPQMMWVGMTCLDRALAAAESVPEADRKQAAIADVHKEKGFLFRNAGRWQAAEQSYRTARDAILVNYETRESDSDHADMASIQTQWAYLMGLRGDFRNALRLVDAAIDARHRLGLHLQEGFSWNVRGEIYRYERRFRKAWESFAVAEQIFQGRRDWSWLGLIYQEQAICIVQAMDEGIDLIPGKDPAGQAKRLITRALDICRDQNLRAYPAALHRAGNILAADDIDVGLGYLAESVDWARRLSDGWFQFASLLDYVELSYRAWETTGRSHYRDAITNIGSSIRKDMSDYNFSDLLGRWLIINGNLALHDYLDTDDLNCLDSAQTNYDEGFRLLAEGRFRSSGSSALEARFDQFSTLFTRLPGDDRARWLKDLRNSWRTVEDGATTLLACLEQLY
jgi:tetratricopeptide (TPR) repeat protein